MSACILGGMQEQTFANNLNQHQSETGIFKFLKKKKKKTEKEDSKDTEKKKSDLKNYDEVITSEAISKNGVIDIHRVKKDYYFELNKNLLQRDFLLVNKISKVPTEINELGFNKGINYQNLLIKFELDTILQKVWVKTYKGSYSSKEGDAITKSVADNYIPSIRESFDLACLGKDSTSYIFKVNKVLMGLKKV